jgi:hypothetical protein
MMLFEMCDLVKERITNINDEVLDKIDCIARENTVENSLKTTETVKHLSYTPVNAETFKTWCDAYKERIRLERMAFETGLELKPTGRELFEKNKQAFEDLTLDSADISELIEENKNDQEEEEEVGDFQYDRALYADDGVDEDINFD